MGIQLELRTRTNLTSRDGNACSPPCYVQSVSKNIFQSGLLFFFLLPPSSTSPTHFPFSMIPLRPIPGRSANRLRENERSGYLFSLGDVYRFNDRAKAIPHFLRNCHEFDSMKSLLIRDTIRTTWHSLVCSASRRVRLDTFAVIIWLEERIKRNPFLDRRHYATLEASIPDHDTLLLSLHPVAR